MGALNFTAPNSTSLRSLDRAALRAILGGPGPCVTVLLPPFKPGEPAGSPAAVLKSAIRQAQQKLADFLPTASVVTLTGPLEEAAHDSELAAGSRWGRAIFRSPGVLEQFQLTRPVEAATFISGAFAIRPLMDELFHPAEFYLLHVGKDAAALFRCRGGKAERVPLPHGIPETLAEAMALEPPDHDLENRSSIRGFGGGAAPGAMSSVRFGTGSERETKHAHLADFYKLVDRGVKAIAGEQAAPLIVAGVEEDAQAFRRISTYHGLLAEGIAGSPNAAGPREETIDRAYAILRADTAARHAANLLAAKERPAAPFSTDPDFLLNAAFEGRVGKLFINAEARRIGVYERANYGSWGEEDLLNLAAIQTILYNGEACELPAAKMPAEQSGEKAAAVGILRY